MLTFSQITAVLAFTGAVVAKPFPLDDRSANSDGVGNTLSLEHPRRSVDSQNGPLEVLKVRRRYNMEVSPMLVAAAERQVKRLASLQARDDEDRGSVAFYQSYNDQQEKTVWAYVGGQELKTTLGLAGADTFFFSNLQPKEQLEGHRYYTVDPAKQKKGYTFGQGFNGGSSPVEGLVYTDNVTLGAFSTNMVFAAATNATKDWYGDKGVDGYIGLGFYEDANGIDPDPQPTFFDSIKKKLHEPIFSSSLRFNKSGKFDFGFVDYKNTWGDFATVDAVHDGWGHWACMIDGFGIGNHNPHITKRDMKIHVDTATTLVFAQPDIVAGYWKLVKGAHFDDANQGFVYPCNTHILPNITFTVKGARQEINGESLRFSPIDHAKKTCFGGLQNIGGGVDFGLFGTPFMENRYVLFNLTDPKGTIGFAPMIMHP
ncbi:Asp domain containing protein [Pyrenophora tritici-repentis]|nr:Asp domain containing protein [Pyrenophora tritici-repentis]